MKFSYAKVQVSKKLSEFVLRPLCMNWFVQQYVLYGFLLDFTISILISLIFFLNSLLSLLQSVC